MQNFLPFGNLTRLMLLAPSLLLPSLLWPYFSSFSTSLFLFLISIKSIFKSSFSLTTGDSLIVVSLYKIFCCFFLFDTSLKVSYTYLFVNCLCFLLCICCISWSFSLFLFLLFRALNRFVVCSFLVFCYGYFLFWTCSSLTLPWYLPFPPPFLGFCSLYFSSFLLLFSFCTSFWGCCGCFLFPS